MYTIPGTWYLVGPINYGPPKYSFDLLPLIPFEMEQPMYRGGGGSKKPRGYHHTAPPLRPYTRKPITTPPG